MPPVPCPEYRPQLRMDVNKRGGEFYSGYIKLPRKLSELLSRLSATSFSVSLIRVYSRPFAVEVRSGVEGC
jgi:hypothetical protein